MLRDWSDEWKHARLALELRSGELFQGETLEITIHATVALDTSSGEASPTEADARSESEVSVSSEEFLAQLESRWRARCDGALVDLKLVEVSPAKQEKGAHPHPPPPLQQPRTTLFHQESRLMMLPVRATDATPTQTPNVLRVALTMRCECTIRVRAEFWQRPLSLIARVTPNSRGDEGANPVAMSVQPLTSMLLSAEYRRDHVYSLLREQTIEPPNLTRRVEHKVRVVKPLLLKMETRFTSENRVVILARATNNHETLAVRVLDLQLHVNQLAGSRAAEYRIAKSPTGNFPVELDPLEQYNFVFFVEPVLDAPEPHEAISSARTTNSSSKQSLLTLSWESATQPGDNARPLLQPVTEQHTILWSPLPHRVMLGASKDSPAAAELLELLPRPPPIVMMGRDAPNDGDAMKGVTVVRRGSSSCPLSVTLAPLDDSIPGTKIVHRVGVVETLCVIVANKSNDSTEFDLSLVVPPAQSTNRSWVAFEAAHHLGRLRAGTIVRKSMRLVFLRHGRTDLNALLLFDHISRTWFLPPPTSSASAWEVYVHPSATARRGVK